MSARPWITHVERDVMEDSELSCGARLTYAILRGYQGKNCREPFPSLATLGKSLGCCRQIVQKYLGELETAGLIRSSGRRSQGKFCSNQYEIVGPPPQSRKLTTVNGTEGVAVVKKTVVENLRSEENRSRESLLLRNPSTKESQYLKESQREKEVTFASMAAAAEHYKLRFPDIPVKDSLSRMRTQKEKQGKNWRNYLNTRYLDKWFAREDTRIPPQLQPIPRDDRRVSVSVLNPHPEPPVNPDPKESQLSEKQRRAEAHAEYLAWKAQGQ